MRTDNLDDEKTPVNNQGSNNFHLKPDTRKRSSNEGDNTSLKDRYQKRDKQKKVKRKKLEKESKFNSLYDSFIFGSMVAICHHNSI